MSDGTVTISIQRFKELEAFESGLGKLEIWDGWGGNTVRLLSSEQMIEGFNEIMEIREKSLKEKIERLSGQNEKLLKENETLKNKKSKWRFW